MENLTRREWNGLVVGGLAAGLLGRRAEGAAPAKARIDSKIKGVQIGAQSYSFRDDFSDLEMDRGFEMAKALGAKVLTASSNQKTVPRIDAFARKHKMRVGLHNHSRIDPNEFATAEDLEKAMAASSEYICTNL